MSQFSRIYLVKCCNTSRTNLFKQAQNNNWLLKCSRIQKLTSANDFHPKNVILKSYNRVLKTTNSPLLHSVTRHYRTTFSQQKQLVNKRNPITMKVDTPEFHALFTPELKMLIKVFEQYGYELRIAGGAVRDLLMGKTANDIDFATTATPKQMKEIFEKEEIRMINTNGEKHGTITCRINTENFEVTTLRIDVATDGRHAEVEFTTDWQVDAMRRDLTINSMFLGFDGTVCDYYNGIRDLEVRKIYYVGDAASRIKEDYLRILRYFRFFGRISEEPNDHDKATLEAIRENIHGLEGISGERIWVELKKIVTGRFAGSLIPIMMQLGMAKYIGLPDESDISHFTAVYDRSQHLDPKPLTLLPALMKDESQLYTFHERVKLSRDELRNGLFILKHRHDDFGDDLLRYCQHLHCDTVGKEPKTKQLIGELIKYVADSKTLESFCVWELPSFPIRGQMLIERGVQKGPKLAKTLNALRAIWKQSDYKLEVDELLEHVEELKKTLT